MTGKGKRGERRSRRLACAAEDPKRPERGFRVNCRFVDPAGQGMPAWLHAARRGGGQGQAMRLATRGACSGGSHAVHGHVPHVGIGVALTLACCQGAGPASGVCSSQGRGRGGRCQLGRSGQLLILGAAPFGRPICARLVTTLRAGHLGGGGRVRLGMSVSLCCGGLLLFKRCWDDLPMQHAYQPTIRTNPSTHKARVLHECVCVCVCVRAYKRARWLSMQ